MTDVRAVSLDCLLKIEKGNFCHLVLRRELEKHSDWERRDRAFLTKLTEGTVEHLYEMDAIIDTYAKIPARKMKPMIRQILRMAVYELRYMDSVPDRAAISEAVRLTKKRGFAPLQGFVNGVLRGIAGGLPDWEPPKEEENFTEWARIACSMPAWITESMVEEYGQSRTAAMWKAGMEERPLSVRFNLSRAKEETILESLSGQNIQAIPVDSVPGAYYLKNYDSPGRIDAFREGLLQVQDVSSMLVGLAAAPKRGDRILDVCGAPGGKGLHAADLLKNTGSVEIRDLIPEKVALIEENIERSKLKNVSARVWDACVFDSKAEETADILIADLPCSGLGIIGRKSDIKYHLKPEAQRELAELQRRILDTVWRYVKPGGRLIYSTCTLFASENLENAEWFADTHPFRRESLAGKVPARFLEKSEDWRMQLLPGEKETDGFFIASFIRERGGKA